MLDTRLMDTIANFLSMCTGCHVSNIPIPVETLRGYLIDIFKCLNVDNEKKELNPIKEAFVILHIAEQYMEEPPTDEDLLIEYKDLSVNCTWERCVKEAALRYYTDIERDLNCNKATSGDIEIKNVE